MLTAKDFQYIYETGELSSELQLSDLKIPSNGNEISAEWINLGNTLNSLAKSLIHDRSSKPPFFGVKRPPFFGLNIKYPENVENIKKLGFKVSPWGESFSKTNSYCLQFLEKPKEKC